MTKGLGVANTKDKIKENHLRRFRHVLRHGISPVRMIEIWNSVD